jgi:hypothetical protein
MKHLFPTQMKNMAEWNLFKVRLHEKINKLEP